MIYMDYAATAPVLPESFAVMKPFLTEEYGNASSLHAAALKSRDAIENARVQAAVLIGASPEEIFFTSGGTESDNWVLFGTYRTWRRKYGERSRRFRVITTEIEHEAVLNGCRMLAEFGAEVRYLKPNGAGRVEVSSVEAALDNALSEGLCPEDILVSVMFANNETGAVQPVAEIGAVCEKYGVPFHSDAVQAAGHVPVDVKEMHIDLLSASAHKFGGPKGSGFLYVRKGTVIAPFMNGGGQENGLRSGTYNTAGIAGLGAAAEVSLKRLPEEYRRIASLRDRLEQRILREIPDAFVNAGDGMRLPGHLSVGFPGVESSALLMLLDLRGVCASGGSACAAGRNEPSHVLLSMGRTEEQADSTVRFSLGAGTDEKEIDEAAEIITEAVGKLREIRFGG